MEYRGTLFHCQNGFVDFRKTTQALDLHEQDSNNISLQERFPVILPGRPSAQHVRNEG